MFVLAYHWLPLVTIDLVGDNRGISNFKDILATYTYYGWFIVLEL